MPDTIPHLAFPLTITPSGGFATVDQDSDAEIIGCVQAVLLCPRGHRDQLPEFGLPPLEFTRLSDDRTTMIRDAILEGEPRAGTVLLDETITDFTATIGAQVSHA